MKIGTTIDTFLKAHKLNKVLISEKDDQLINAAIAEIDKMSSPEDWGVIYDPYLNRLTNTSFFCGAALMAGAIALGVTVVKVAKKLSEKESGEKSE